MIYCYTHFVNSIQNDKKLNLSKLKAFADDKSNVDKMLITVRNIVGNIVELIRENAG